MELASPLVPVSDGDPSFLSHAMTRLYLGYIHNLLTPPAPGPEYILPYWAMCVSSLIHPTLKYVGVSLLGPP